MSINIGIRDTHITAEGYLAAPVATAATGVTTSSFYANWESVAVADGYYLDVAYDNLFTSYVMGYQNLNVGLILTYQIDTLTDNTTYYYRLRAYKALDTSANSNIITVTTELEYTACATYQPYFNPEPVDGLMFLACGSLYLTSGTLGHYVIEWNLGSPAGATQFISGDDSTFDGDVQEEHPLVESVVFAGTLYPVIRYVYVNGIKYTAEWEAGSRYSPDLLTCLDPVIISSITCSTIYGGDTNYPNYKLTYDNTNPGSFDKSRTLKYDVCPDMGYLAWSFKAEYVADQLEIYYCTSIDPIGTLVDNFIIGYQSAPNVGLVTNLYPVNYPTDPIYYQISYADAVRFITDISAFTYVAGNYLRIVITGSVLEPSNDATDWEIKLLNLEASDLDFTFEFTPTNIYKIADTPSISYDATNCWYNVTYNTIEVATNYFTSFAYKYLMLQQLVLSGNAVANQLNVNPINMTLSWNTFGSSGSLFYTGTGAGTLVNLATIDPGPPIIRETISVIKTTDNLTLVFTDEDDYNLYKSNITAIQADSDYIAWLTTNDTQYQYYKYYYIYYPVASSIGDSTTIRAFSISLNTTITYDDINHTIDFTLIVPTNNFVDVSCSTVYEAIDQVLSYITTTKNLVLMLEDSETSIRTEAPVRLYGVTEIERHETTRTVNYQYYIYERMANGLFDFKTIGFCDDGTAMHPLILYRHYDRLSFTDTTDHAARLANWKLERIVKLRTDNCADTGWETVYETP